MVVKSLTTHVYADRAVDTSVDVDDLCRGKAFILELTVVFKREERLPRRYYRHVDHTCTRWRRACIVLVRRHARCGVRSCNRHCYTMFAKKIPKELVYGIGVVIVVRGMRIAFLEYAEEVAHLFNRRRCFPFLCQTCGESCHLILDVRLPVTRSAKSWCYTCWGLLNVSRSLRRHRW